MKIRGGHTVEVYRVVTGRDRYGEATPQLIGSIDHVVFQWGTPRLVDDAQESDMFSTVIFAPRDAAIRLQARDRVKYNGEMYVVIGDRSWDENHPVTGHDFGYYMMQVEVMG